MKIVKEHINEVIKSRGIFPLPYVPPYEGDIDLSGKNITSLPKDLPKKITGSFFCHNTKITSLVGAPQSLGASFFCDHNKITSLEGAPQYVGESFFCDNTNINSLVGAPQSVGRSFSCYYTNITSLEGAPQSVGENFYCGNTKVTKEEVERYFESGAVRRTIYSDYGEYKRN